MPKLVHACTLLIAVAARGEPLDLGDGAEARWTNTVRLGSLYQFNSLPPTSSGYCVNCGYEQGFSQGRVDWQSELAVSQGSSLAHLSLDARRDVVESRASYLELYEAYGQTGFALFGRPLTVAIGRQNLIWGESLLFPTNAIAGAQAPLDSTNGRGAVGYQAASRFLPVAQASFNWQVTDNLALAFYQQGEWRRSRVDPHDVYAGPADLYGAEGNQLVAFTLPRYLSRFYYYRADSNAPAGWDQFGAALKGQAGEADFGLYALRFEPKTPDLAYDPYESSFRLTYAKAAELVGASLALPVADSNLAAEISARHGMPLVTGGIFYDDKVPRGDTLQGQISLTRAIAPQFLLPGGASWSTELAANHADQTTPGRTGGAAAIRSVFTAQFYQLLPRLDLSLPLSVGYNFYGLSPVLPEMNRGTGDLGAGATFSFDQRWTLSLGVTHYFGTAKIPEAPYPFTTSYGGQLSRWDEASLVLETSF
jgi:hypothetical protein